ncbi:palmitoyltransferase, putative (DHHC5) [Plasmodium ovale curtisi]|uniref:Palmitoyltransferase n=1 Tax=Plasmodium ovale curtisi TaxID=864141 RepID=A0A1A8W2M1_PLAOA|nr:palmitoyltransferase, putative (DHHC5) [Plasmodium ovale curtisi]
MNRNPTDILNMPHSVSEKAINMNSILFELVKRKDEKIYHFLEQDKDLINCQDENGNSLLHWAVFLSNVYLVCYLLEKNADANIKSGNGQTPLFWAVCTNNIFMIYLLNKYGCNLYEIDNKGYNCLTISVQYNYVLSFFYLIYLGVPITHKDFNNCSVLDWASYNNNIFFLRLFSTFINKLYSIHLSKPSSILHKAILGNAYEAVLYLILNNLQSVQDIATDDNKTIVQFIEENRDQIDPRIYMFLKSKKTQRLCKENNKEKIDALYKPNGTIGPYIIKKKRNVQIGFIFPLYVPLASVTRFIPLFEHSILRPCNEQQQQKKDIKHLGYPSLIRMHTHGNFLLDMFHPALFVIYYFVVSSNPGYLESPKMDKFIGKGDGLSEVVEDSDLLHGNNKTEETQMRAKKEHNEECRGIKREDRNNGEEEVVSEKNATFLFIIKNVQKEIEIYEGKNRLVKFREKVKYENIFKLKKELDIRWDICTFEISSFDINKLCPSCFLFKNIRTKHCRYCDKCVDIYDHHCMFTLNCMGIDNSRIFLSWIVSNILFSFFTFYLYISFLIKFTPKYYDITFFISLISVILCLLFTYFMGSVFLRSIFNILENITSNEKFKLYTSKTFFTYELKLGENNEPVVVRKFKNPFDQGAYFNVLNFLKKSKKDLTQGKKTFIQIGENVRSDQIRVFVEKLNERLRQMYASTGNSAT